MTNYGLPEPIAEEIEMLSDWQQRLQKQIDSKPVSENKISVAKPVVEVYEWPEITR